MNNGVVKQATLLTFFGAIPFLIGAVALMLGLKNLALHALLAYSAIIIAFISGSHWGIVLRSEVKKMNWIITFCNITALVAWCCMLLPNAKISLMVMILTFALLLLVDYQLYVNELIDVWYLKLRLRVTLLVIIALVLSLIGLIFTF